LKQVSDEEENLDLDALLANLPKGIASAEEDDDFDGEGIPHQV
jgi:hypothetical protein